MKLQNDESFEKGFREAFDKASLAPPDVIWENIEKELPAPDLNGSKPDVSTISTATKLMVATGVTLLSGIAFYYFNKPSTNINDNILNPIKNENTFTPAIEPKNLDSDLEKPNLAKPATFVAKKQINYKPAPVLPFNNLDERDQIVIPEPETKEEMNLPTKIDEMVTEITPKGLSFKKIVMDTPDLVPNTDSQTIVPYYDPNAVPSQQKKKGQFLQNFKIRGGIRVSN